MDFAYIVCLGCPYLPTFLVCYAHAFLCICTLMQYLKAEIFALLEFSDLVGQYIWQVEILAKFYYSRQLN